jgi:cytidine deaminase
MVVVTDDDNISSPCGACCQVMAEFVDTSFPVILANLNNQKKKLRFEELLPHPFTPANTIGRAEN